MDTTASNVASVVEKEILFALDNKTLLILAQFKKDILNAITTFKEDIAVVTIRDEVQHNIAEHSSLIAPTPTSDQLLSKFEYTCNR